jgi:hypothetical protein
MIRLPEKLKLNTLVMSDPLTKETAVQYQYPPKAQRFKVFIDRLSDAPAASNRESALALLKRIMGEVEDECVGVDVPYSDKMHVYGFCRSKRRHRRMPVCKT